MEKKKDRQFGRKRKPNKKKKNKMMKKKKKKKKKRWRKEESLASIAQHRRWPLVDYVRPSPIRWIDDVGVVGVVGGVGGVGGVGAQVARNYKTMTWPATEH